MRLLAIQLLAFIFQIPKTNRLEHSNGWYCPGSIDLKMKKNFAKRLFSSCKTTIPQLCNAWQIADKYQPLLGPRTVIISSNDKLSKELSQRMWYEMQRVGIQSAFITLNTPFPVLNAIQESLSLFRRTGAKSIITIGNGAIADYGKALRSCAETALMPHQLMKSKMYTQRETIPLFCVRTSLSKVPFTSTLQVLHPEDDVLISAEGRAPEVGQFWTSILFNFTQYCFSIS